MIIRNRRDFLRQISYGSTAILISPSILSACQTGTVPGEKNSIDLDGIIPITFINDAAGLILMNGNISETTREALTADINLNISGNMSRIAAGLCLPEVKILDLLAKLKREWSDRDSDMKLEHKYSLFLGWIIYSGFRTVTGDLYHKLINKGYHYDDIRIFHDAFMFRQISNISSTTDPLCSVQELAELFQIMLPRMITRLHTFMPDSDDGKQWVLDITEWRKANKKLMSKYAAAYVNPSTENIERFILQPGFYAVDDQIIQIARKLHNGVHVSAEEISSTLKSDSGNSLYAKSLVRGLKKAELTDQYFTDKLSHSDFSNQIASI